MLVPDPASEPRQRCLGEGETMSDVLEGLFDLVGGLAEAGGKAAELAVEGAGVLLEGSKVAAEAVAENAGPAMVVAAKGAGKLAGAAAEGVMLAADEGLLEGALDVAGSSVGGSAPAQASTPPC